jgi:hypothetical protein
MNAKESLPLPTPLGSFALERGGGRGLRGVLEARRHLVYDRIARRGHGRLPPLAPLLQRY